MLTIKHFFFSCHILHIDSPPKRTAPAVSSARLRIAEETGKNAVKAALSVSFSPSPSSSSTSSFALADILTYDSFHNAITVLHAIGGSTNAIVHLLALANRHPALEGHITLQTVDDIGRRTPLLVDLKPSGDNYMTDLRGFYCFFYYYCSFKY